MNRHFRVFATIICTLLSMTVLAQTTVWRDIHKVKKRETVFGIAKDYGITIEQLLDANPEMKAEGYELKKGDWIFVPYSKSGDKKADKTSPTTTTSSVQKPAVQKSEKATEKVLNVGVMLPLHNINGDGRRMTEYYRGLLMAVEDLKKQGQSINVFAWNVPEEADIRTILLDKNAAKCNIIFGPLYTKMVKPLADFCKQYNIRLVIPFSISGNDVNEYEQIFQVYQDDYDMNLHAVNAFLERFSTNGHPIFVDCNDETSRKGNFTTALRTQLTAQGIAYNITNLNTSDENFAKAFVTGKKNVVVLNTARSPELNAVFAKLDELKKSNPKLQIAIYGYTEWLMYRDYDLKNFYKYNVYIPTTYYYNNAASKTKEFESRYRTEFGSRMMQSLPRFPLTGYDQGMYFLSGMAKYGTAFVGSQKQSSYKSLQTRLRFARVNNTGGYKNNNFQLIHYLDNQTVEAINY